MVNIPVSIVVVSILNFISSKHHKCIPTELLARLQTLCRVMHCLNSSYIAHKVPQDNNPLLSSLNMDVKILKSKLKELK